MVTSTYITTVEAYIIPGMQNDLWTREMILIRSNELENMANKQSAPHHSYHSMTPGFARTQTAAVLTFPAHGGLRYKRGMPGLRVVFLIVDFSQSGLSS